MTGDDAESVGTSLLVQVRTRLALHLRRRARSPLPGEYVSVHKGRSMDFDDLREYEHGDDVRDIDWKSTARTGSVRLKRYVAERKHHVLLVVDTGRPMAAQARDGSPKGALALLVAGAFSSVVVDHGDLVGLLAGDADERTMAPWRSSPLHLERVLRALRGRLADPPAGSDLDALLEHALDRHRRRLVVVVVTDEAGWCDTTAELVRRMRARHEIFWFTVLDVDPTDERWAERDVLDVVTGERLPAELRHDPIVCEQYRRADAEATTARRAALAALGVTAEEVTGVDDAVPAVLRLLDRSRRVPA